MDHPSLVQIEPLNALLAYVYAKISHGIFVMCVFYFDPINKVESRIILIAYVIEPTKIELGSMT